MRPIAACWKPSFVTALNGVAQTGIADSEKVCVGTRLRPIGPGVDVQALGRRRAREEEMHVELVSKLLREYCTETRSLPLHLCVAPASEAFGLDEDEVRASQVFPSDKQV